MKDVILEELRKAFRPEFLNRIDDTIVFHSLTEDHLKQIVEIQLGHLRQRLVDHHVTLELTDAAKSHVVRIGYEPTYGARPLKRVLQRELETVLARKLLSGEGRDGPAVTVDFDEKRQELLFK